MTALEHMPALPRSLKDFLVYYWRFDPKRWLLFMVQDTVHYCRYPLSFFCVGRCVDILTAARPTNGVPV